MIKEKYYLLKISMLIDTGKNLFYENKLVESYDKLQEAVSICNKIIRKNKNFSDAYHNKAIALDFLARIEQGKGNIEGAEVYIKEGIENVKIALDLKPNKPEYLNNLGIKFLKLGEIFLEKESYKEAQKYFLKAVDIFDQILDLYSKSIGNKALALGKLAEIKANIGSKEEAIKYINEALELISVFIDRHENILEARKNRILLQKTKAKILSSINFKEAEAALKKALEDINYFISKAPYNDKFINDKVFILLELYELYNENNIKDESTIDILDEAINVANEGLDINPFLLSILGKLYVNCKREKGETI